MPIKVGINGLGRIGRTILRECFRQKSPKIDIVAVNNPGDPQSYVHLLKYDSIHGPSNKNIRYSVEEKSLYIDDHRIRFFNEKLPQKICWEESSAEIVIDGTGVFRDRDSLGKHLGKSVKKVILCAPGSDVDGTFVMGINHSSYDSKQHHIISNASCTTNCLAPVAQILHENWGIETGMMVTVHAYTSDQSLLDRSHSDLRRARSAAMSMIPTSTGAAKALGLVIPELSGKLDGHAVRVPTADVSLIDFTVSLQSPATRTEINKKMQQAAAGKLKNILAYTDEPLVSIDFTGRSESSIFDASCTHVIGKMARVLSWYDNEVGFSNRVIDMAEYIGKDLL